MCNLNREFPLAAAKLLLDFPPFGNVDIDPDQPLGSTASILQSRRPSQHPSHRAIRSHNAKLLFKWPTPDRFLDCPHYFVAVIRMEECLPIALRAAKFPWPESIHLFQLTCPFVHTRPQVQVECTDSRGLLCQSEALFAFAQSSLQRCAAPQDLFHLCVCSPAAIDRYPGRSRSFLERFQEVCIRGRFHHVRTGTRIQRLLHDMWKIMLA